MSIPMLLLLALGLSMDAFAVSLSNGLSYQRSHKKVAFVSAFAFGFFQGLMPVIGYFAGRTFAAAISSIDHWIACLLLGLIGVNMIRESREASCPLDSSFSPRAMLPLAVATSIDALAVGITFAFLNVKILPAVIFIGTVTFLLSAAGVRVGAVFGARFRSKAELAGGVILILMGLKILLEHLGVLG